MGRRIIYFSIAIAIILLLAFIQGGCGNTLLEDLIVAAIANAREKAKSLMEDEMKKVLPPGLGNFDIPGFG